MLAMKQRCYKPMRVKWKLDDNYEHMGVRVSLLYNAMKTLKGVAISRCCQ